MAAEAVSGAIGLFGDTLGLYQNLQDFLFPNSNPKFANVRISIGQIANLSDTQRSLGGDAPGIALFDAIAEYVGSEAGHTKNDIQGTEHIDKGTSRDYSIETPLAPEFISVVAGGSDGACIHAVTMEANGLSFSWTGDIGKACGAEWYPQKNAIDSTPNRPACIWIDTNGDSGHVWKGFNIHLPSFSAEAEIQQKESKLGRQTKP
jgi:hypothetical protein